MSETPRKQIDSICNEFESDWSQDRPPDFESWLQRVPQANRQQLAKELLAVHFELLLEAGENPVPAEFAHLGVEVNSFAANVVTRLRNVAQEYTATFDHLQDSQNAESPSANLVTRSLPSFSEASKPEIPEKLGEFQIIRKIGQGGMGSVFEAEHIQRKTRVALKTLPEVSAETLYLFKREFRTLAKISHPNLVGLHRLQSEGESWFFTMDLIRGSDFLSYIRPDGVLDSERLQSAYRQLVEAVAELHRRKILHRDLKPSNVMIDDSGTLKVLDFGLVFDLATEQELKSNFICGTPAYMSPEQFSGSDLTPASDWFSVGVMLYEAIDGKRPWQGNLKELMHAKLNYDPPRLSIEAGNGLSGITHKLLCRHPADRYDPTIDSNDRTSTSDSIRATRATAEATLLGRESQFALLKESYQTFRDTGDPTVVFVSGRSGEGKTHLTKTFIDSVREDPISILSGRCYDRESVPFKAVDHLIESLAEFMARRSDQELRKLLPRDVGILTQVFPAFLRMPEVESVTRNTPIPQDGREIRKRAFLALRELIHSISAEKPILLFLDDMQWGDAESAELIREIARTPNAPRVLLLMTYRSDEATTSAFLNYWNNSKDDDTKEQEIEIGALPDSEIERLVERYVLRDDADRFSRVMSIAKETGGNPFLLIEFLESLESSGEEVKVRPLAEVIERKLDKLPQEAKAILEYFAVSGQAVQLEDITDAYGAERLPMETIYRMQNENLLRQVGDDAALRFDTYHDKVRETVLSNFDVTYKGQLHRRMAVVIEEKIGGFPDEIFSERIKQKNKTFDEEIQSEIVPRVYDLSYHYDEAGESDLAARYAFVAAYQAKSQFSLEVAVAQFEIFKRNSENLPPSIKFQAGESYGFCLLRIGQFEKSDFQLQETMKFAESEIERGRLISLQAEVCFENAQFERGIAIAKNQLRALKVFLPKNKWLSVLHGMAIVAYHLVCVQFLENFIRRHKAWTETDYVIYELFRKLMYLAMYVSTPLHLTTVCRCAQNLVRRNYDWSVADFDGIGSVPYTTLGLTAVAEESIRRAREFSEKSNDSRLLGNTKFGESVVRSIGGEFSEHERLSTESTQLLEQTGDLWKIHGNRCMTILVSGKRGDVIKAVQVAKQSIRSQLRRGATAYALDAACFWVIASRGNAPFKELLELCAIEIENPFQKSIQAYARIHWHSFHGRHQQAFDVACESINFARISQCLSIFSASFYPNLVKTSCALVRHEPDMNSRRRRRILKKAMIESKRGLAVTKTFRLDRAWALREHAELLRLLGKWRKAERFAVESCELADKQGAKVDLIYSRRTLARIQQGLGQPDADDLLRHAESEIEAFNQSIDDANEGAMEFVQSMR